MTFSPENGYVGDPTPIEYTIEDIKGNETTAEISINYPPVANDDNVSLEEGETAIFLNHYRMIKTHHPDLDPERVSLVAPNTAIDVITDH